MKPNYLKRYIISSYILVWSLIIFVAGPASLIFRAPPVVMWLVRNLISWSPTYLLLLGWKRFRPEETRTAFVKRCFLGKLRPFMLLGAFGLVFGISILSLFIYSAIEGQPAMSHIDFGTVSLPLSVFLAFTSGPTGEELGWRGFMKEEVAARYGFLKSSICQGLVWCFWHTLLWAVDSDFTDWRAVPYIISNIVVITCLTVLMNIFLDAGIGFFVILTVLYPIITAAAVMMRNKKGKSEWTDDVLFSDGTRCDIDFAEETEGHMHGING